MSTIEATTRETKTKGQVNDLRSKGYVPGIIYGDDQEPILISMDPSQLIAEMSKPGFSSKIFEIQVKDKKAEIKMTLTTPNCPVAESLPKEVKDGVMQVDGIDDVDLKLVWDPPWTKDMMSDAAKLELNL